MGLGLDPGDGLGAGVGDVALRQQLYWLGADWTANDSTGSVLLYVHWHEPLSVRFPSGRFNHKQYNDH